MTWAEHRRSMDEAQAEVEADAEMEEEEEEQQQLLWGTWEELVLACAVQRYGTRNWDLISNELQARNLGSTHAFSPQVCKARYDALRGRFNVSSKGEDEEEEEEARPRIPWLDELRRVRVAQLRRELQRSDDSIGSLQSKLQRLEADRAENQRADSKLDLDRDRERSSAGSQIEEPSRPADPAPQNRSPAPEPPTENRPPSDPAPEQQLPPAPASPLDSFYGSSETLENAQPRRQRSWRPRKQQPQQQPTPQLQHQHQHQQQQEDGPLLVPHKEVEDGADVAATAAVDPDDDRASIGCTDGPDAQPRQRPRGRRQQSKSEPSGESERRAGNVPLESDVLSSANPGKNADGKESVDYGATRSSGDSQIDRAEGTDEIEHENDNDNENENDNSPMSRRTRREPKVAGKLLPLLDCLRAVASHKFGHIFKHRLESQKTQRYRELIRRHMDLSTIRSRLEDGTYSGSTEFFRDLLLVFNNALVYFPRSSQEHAAARQLQQQARKEMAKILQTEALLKQDGPSTRKREPRGPQNSNSASPAVKFTVSRKRGARSAPGRPKSGTKTPEKLAAEDVKPTEMLTPKTEEKVEGSATGGARVNGDTKKSQKSQSQGQTKKEAENAVKPESNPTPPPLKRGVGRPPKHAKRQQSGTESAPRPRKRPRPRR